MKIRNIILSFIGILAFTSCQDMFEPAEENNRTEDAMTEESKYAHGLLMYAYDRLPYTTTTQTDVATDDAVTNAKNSTYLNMATVTWAADNNPMTQWDACKDGIQYANIFLTKVKDVKWSPSDQSKQKMFINRMKGEAYGLRAIFYYYLLQAHGGYADNGVLYGVPMLTTPEDGSSNFNVERATFASCVEQCFNDCDSAKKYLPLEYKDLGSVDDIPTDYSDATLAGFNAVFGSASKGLISGKIAEAVKAQVALLAASPAFREQSLVESDKAAALCADALKHINGMNGFDKNGNIWYRNTNMLKDEAAEMPEILWRFSKSKNSDQESDNFPPSLFGYGRVNPSQNLVDAFPMRNGLPITDKRSGYNENDPYANRDPRLSDNIIYDGTTFGVGAKKAVITTGIYDKTLDNLNDNSYSTRTGYYLKKLLREEVTPKTSGSEIPQNHVYPRIRYTELFLAYAEAANDAWGPMSAPDSIGFTAYDVIKAIRSRAGLGTNEVGMPLPEGDVYLDECAKDKAKMAELIRNERRLELCFENKRFWDLRRWMLPLDETVKGVLIDRNEETKELTYTYIDVEDRKYDNSYQWYGPIPKGEVLKWSNLKQNKGWK